jgi:DNA-binding transcriptional LysR family regulator
VKQGGFSSAAKALFISQPAVSAQIKILEESYKIKLFERSPKKIELTKAGNILFSYAEKIFDLTEKADRALGGLTGVRTEDIRISAILTLGAYYVPSIINEFKKKYPGIEIHLTVGYTYNVINNVLSMNSDLGLIGSAISDENLLLRPLWEEPLVLIVSPSHKLASQLSVDIYKLKDEDFIIPEKGSGVRDVINNIFGLKGISLNVIMELGENEAVKRAVAAGLGVSLISPSVIRKEVSLGILHALKISNKKVTRKYYAIYRKDRHINDTINNFIDMALLNPI